MKLGARLRKLEKIAHDRLAAAAAEAAIPEEPQLSLRELRRLDAHTLVQMCRKANHPSKVTETEEYRRLYAHYRRLPLLELLDQYRELKRLKREARPRSRCIVVSGTNKDRNLPTQPKPAPPVRLPHVAAFKKSPVTLEPPPPKTENVPSPIKEPWRFAWAV
jgi:hypothetical protein